MDRRNFLLAGAAGAAAFAARPDIRALAQSAAGTLTYGCSTPVLTLDPGFGAFTAYPGGYEASLVLYDRLIDFDADMRFVPGLAVSWQFAPDMRSITLRLRQGVRFHDGTPFDTAAVRFNIERMMDRQRNPTNRPLWDPIAGVETPDAETVVIRARAPYAQLPNTLAHGSGAMVSPAAVERHGERGIAQNPVGTGPYAMESFTPGQVLNMRAVENHWSGRPGAQRLVFRYIAEAATRISALRTGAVEVIDGVPAQLAEPLTRDANLQVIRRFGLRPIGLAINLTRPQLQDVRVRRAMNLAVPVETIASRAFFGFARASNSPLAFDTPGHVAAGAPRFDQAQARALLAEAGYRPGPGGVLEREGRPLRVAISVPDGLFPADVQVAEIVVASFRQVGIDATINRVERAAYFDMLRQDRANMAWDLAMFGFNPSNASGLYHLESLFRSNTDDAARPDVWNIGRYRNPAVDAALARANTDPSPEGQNAALAEAQRLIWEDAPYVWLQVNENISAARRNVQGVSVWPIVFTALRSARI